jgi:hypothetical protein
MMDVKHDVYQAEYIKGSPELFSAGVTRAFGTNKIVFVDGHQIFASVMPLMCDPETDDTLERIGYLVNSN